ncbi:MAG: hypothetical protein HLUCCX14_16390 [Marinobacter excellens HL-55]|uniref:Uncharacterized protein n=1 Tax=Marinobacter excellens HL-55 TaxID=1305731 RepID=A0A0P7Z551_9GAMM|nr:MAG: hypothetical protein HLUCCX14_16390 [Marinobacter excellens HL-55]
MSNETLRAEELGNKLLQSVKEMKAGNAARVSRVEPNEVAKALIEIAFRHPEVIREDLELKG